MGGNNQFDVIVVGGGPAGATAAYHLAESGSLSVLVVDRSSFPRHKTCGGALLACHDWPAEFPNYAEIEPELSGHPSQHVCFCVDRTLWWEGSDGHFYDHIHRYDFDNRLLQAALGKPGVSFREFNARSLERLPDGRMRLSNGTESLEARAVIGADGVSGFVSKVLGNTKRKKNELGICFLNHVACEKPHEKTFIWYLWDGELGYSYLFPTDDGYYVGVGYLGLEGKRARKLLSDLMDYCVEEGLLPQEYALRRDSGAIAPATVVDHIAEDGILLVGDAAGLLSQINGEGIYYAMKSGQMAGRILTESFDGAAARYIRAVKPLVNEVTYVKTIRPKLYAPPLKGYFATAKLAELAHLDGPLKRPFINRLLHRQHLPKGSRYQKIR